MKIENSKKYDAHFLKRDLFICIISINYHYVIYSFFFEFFLYIVSNMEFSMVLDRISERMTKNFYGL
jgi:hypothetical protein